LILPGGARKDRIVNNDAMDLLVLVRSENGFFDVFFCNLAEFKSESTVRNKLASAIRVVILHV
jgi:hypothetical protein